jgi:hypothetical protein
VVPGNGTGYDDLATTLKEKMMSQRSVFLAAALIFVLLVSAVPAEAQRDFEPLFDKFNFKLEGSWVGLTTDIRLDSELLGRGTTLSFEDDLNLDSGKTIPTLSFEWQIAKKHKLGVRWQDINRDSTAQALTEIQWGDEIIPIDANISLGFDITQAFIDYAYYPWVKDRWAAGFGLGLRWMDIQATLAYRGVGEEETIEGSSDVKGSAPLPYIYFEYRRLLSDNWRFITGLGWLYVKIDDIEGGQLIGRLRIEYLTDRRWGFGAAVNFANAGVDWAAIATEEENILDARIDLDIWDFSVFVRVRF